MLPWWTLLPVPPSSGVTSFTVRAAAVESERKKTKNDSKDFRSTCSSGCGPSPLRHPSHHLVAKHSQLICLLLLSFSCLVSSPSRLLLTVRPSLSRSSGGILILQRAITIRAKSICSHPASHWLCFPPVPLPASLKFLHANGRGTQGKGGKYTRNKFQKATQV